MLVDGDATALLAEIDAEQARLRTLLAGMDEPELAERPSDGKWSVVENVRHLLFAEQLHLGGFIPGGQQSWAPLGLPPDGMRRQQRFLHSGTAPVATVWEVLDAWQAVHDPIRQLAREDTETLRTALQRNLRHLRAHVKVIERLLRQPGPLPEHKQPDD